jgi:hypothetical protein
MPTYTVTTLEGCLDKSKPAKIASEITDPPAERGQDAHVPFVHNGPARY